MVSSPRNARWHARCPTATLALSFGAFNWGMNHARDTARSARAANCQGLTRRAALKAGFLGLARPVAADLLRLRAEAAALATTRRVHPSLARRRPQPARNLRSQAGSAGRVSRTLQGHQHQRARHPHLRDAAAPRPPRRQDGVRPLRPSRHRRSLRRRSLDADRSLRLDHAQSGAEVSVRRLLCLAGARSQSTRSAALRRPARRTEHLPLPGLPGRRLSGARLQPVRRRSRPEVSRRQLAPFRSARRSGSTQFNQRTAEHIARARRDLIGRVRRLRSVSSIPAAPWTRSIAISSRPST